MKLTAKQEKFCQEVVLGKSYSDAYRTAYNCEKMKDETIHKRASELYNNREIKGRLEELRLPKQKEVVENYGVTLEFCIKQSLWALENEKKKKKDYINNKTIHDISMGIAKALGLDKAKQNIDLTTKGENINFPQFILNKEQIKDLGLQMIKMEDDK